VFSDQRTDDNFNRDVGACFACPNYSLGHIDRAGMQGEQFLLIMLAIGVAVMFGLSKFRSRRRTPKEKATRVKLRRTIARRGRITILDNPLKIGLRQPLKVSQAQCVAIYRGEQLKIQQSPAVEALENELRSLGIPFRREEPIIVDYKRFFLVDVWCRNNRIGFEADGSHHRQQHPYDNDRDAIIQRLTGFKILRSYNRWYFKPGLRDRVLIELGRK
jgi:very-short-patch-repair endonuclease